MVHAYLKALGISFELKGSYELAPEEMVLNLIKDHEILSHRRELSMLIAAFKQFQKYYRPELFSHLIKGESRVIQAALGGVIFRDGLKNQTRWSGLKRKLKINSKNKIVIGNIELIKAKGNDRYFNDCGILMTGIRKTSSKKLLTKEFVLKNNIWFKNRIIFGANTRADINTIRTHHLESTPYAIAKRFKQSYPSIHGIWNDIIYAQKLGLEVA